MYFMFIRPLEIIMETIYGIVLNKTESYGIAIVALSLIVNILVLPLYNRADRLQAETAEKREKIGKWQTHIRKTFRGEERFMMLQAYYRETGYSTLGNLGGAVALLIEIPFFIAAYHFLSNYHAMFGKEFFIIRDLGKPDALLSLGNIGVNVLPILMTIINLVSGGIYLRKSTAGQKLQVFGMAVIFLVLLYDSPSGLVLYWTLNNVFSLGKNIVALIAKRFPRKEKSRELPVTSLHVLAVLALISLTGVFIPSSVVASSPLEFIGREVMVNPVHYVVTAVVLALGTFGVWLSVYYFLLRKSLGKWTDVAEAVLITVALFDHFLSGTAYGRLTDHLRYENSPEFTYNEIFINLLILLVVVVITAVVSMKTGIMRWLYISVTAVLLMMSGINIVKIHQASAEYLATHEAEEGGRKASLELSKEGRNVVVIMIDSAIGPYVPFIMAERPELKEQFDGFTWYSNVISHGNATNFGAPGLYGGYEYTPEAMDKRTDMLISEKHDEALKVMPGLFSEGGYDVEVVNPPYAGYQEIADLSIFDGMEGVNAYSNNDIFGNPEEAGEWERLKENGLFRFSLFRIMPTAGRMLFYNMGRYHDPVTNEKKASYLFQPLSELSASTRACDEGDHFILLCNETPHNSVILLKPDYDPFNDNEGTMWHEGQKTTDADGNILKLETETDEGYYDTNMYSLMKLGEWFDHLRQEGVYDNTRIILVSDHGSSVSNLGQVAVCQAACFLMMKDFNAEGFTVSEDFMTNADTPSLACAGVLEGAANPFTGNVLDGHEKAGEQTVVVSQNWKIQLHTGNTFVMDPEDRVYHFSGNIYDPSCWVKIKP
ncbi:MAG: membrane protein insertase YidC [Lachnospiraceae bacterium]|nr:membrane protein insertase YidC [Lachnospiraceae bacterium]